MPVTPCRTVADAPARLKEWHPTNSGDLDPGHGLLGNPEDWTATRVGTARGSTPQPVAGFCEDCRDEHRACAPWDQGIEGNDLAIRLAA
jgi:hypothetical protein